MKKFILSFTIFVLLASSFSCARFAYVENRRGYRNLRDPYVRVRIHQEKEVRLECSGPFELYCIKANGEAVDYFSNSALIMKLQNGSVDVFQETGLPLEKSVSRVVASPKEQSSYIRIDSAPYRGVAEVIVEDTILSVVNAIYMEDYLKGVLPPEIGKHGAEELEALKAQAVASRTYAFSRFRRNPARRYDMVNEVADQVYTGMRGEDKWTNRAIDETRGEVLMSGGNLITAYYHSTCGGNTDNIEDVWDRQPVSYLKGADDDAYCTWSKFYSWSFEWGVSDLSTNIRKYLKAKGRLNGDDEFNIRDIKIVDRLSSGRIKILKIVTEVDEYLLFKDQIRWAILRPDREGAILPSTNFEVSLNRDNNGVLTSVVFEGFGNGHGVGMCQCGALGRARVGQTYRTILSTYYRNTKITNLY